MGSFLIRPENGDCPPGNEERLGELDALAQEGDLLVLDPVDDVRKSGPEDDEAVEERGVRSHDQDRGLAGIGLVGKQNGSHLGQSFEN